MKTVRVAFCDPQWLQCKGPLMQLSISLDVINWLYFWSEWEFLLVDAIMLLILIFFFRLKIVFFFFYTAVKSLFHT